MLPARTNHARRGQSLVESAFVLLVFLVTLIGIFDLGLIMFLHQTFVERARNAVRYSVVRAYDPAVVRNMVLYNQPSAPDGSPTGYMGLTPAMIDVQRLDTGTNEDRIVITIRDYPYRFFSPLIAGQFYGRHIVLTLPVEGT